MSSSAGRLRRMEIPGARCREKETKEGVSVLRGHAKGNEGRRSGVKILLLAQLELEEDVPIAGWVRKGSKR